MDYTRRALDTRHCRAYSRPPPSPEIYFDAVEKTPRNPEKGRGITTCTQTRSPTPPFYTYSHDSLANYEVYTNPRHSDSAMNKMYDFYVAGQLFDVTLIADNETIQAHRVVLSSASNYFAAMFNSNLLESKSETVLIKDVSGAALRDLVTYAYTGQISIMQKNCEAILSAACLLGFLDVVEVCSKFLKQQLDPANCIGIAFFADARSLSDLRDLAWNYIEDKFEKVVENQEFLMLDHQEVVKILSSDELNVVNEFYVFEAVMKWVNHDRENRMKFMKTVLACVKLPMLSPRYIAEKVTPVVGDEGRELVIEALEYHLLPQKRAKMDPYRIVPRKSTVDWVFAIADIIHDRKPYLQGYSAYETFCLRMNNWVPCGPIPTKKKHLVQHAIATIGEKIYVVGGRDGLKTLNTLKCIDGHCREWTKHQGMATPRHGLGLAVIGPNGPLYAIGGHDGWSYLNSVERWDVESGTWSFVEPLSTARSTVGVGVINNKIYAVGGKDAISCLNLVEQYDPMTNRWKQCAPMIKKRGGVAVAVLHGLMYAFGGYDSAKPVNQKNMRHATVERYDPRTDKWSIVTKMDCGRDGIGVTVLGNRILTAGGFDGSLFTTIAELYDPVGNKWTKLRNMNVGRAGHFITAIRVINWDEDSLSPEDFTTAEYVVSDTTEEDEPSAIEVDDNEGTA